MALIIEYCHVQNIVLFYLFFTDGKVCFLPMRYFDCFVSKTQLIEAAYQKGLEVLNEKSMTHYLLLKNNRNTFLEWQMIIIGT